MYSKFATSLRRIGFNKARFPEAAEVLQQGVVDIEETIKENIFGNSEALKRYCVLNINEIRKRYAEIDERLEQLQFKPEELRRTPYMDIVRREAEIDYFGEIYNLCREAESILVEYLAAYHPQSFQTDENRQYLQKLLPSWNTARQIAELAAAPPASATEDKPEPTPPKNPYPRIFTSDEAWELFNEWHLSHVRKKLADYSFIYWVMSEDGLIHSDIKPTPFKEWIESKLNTGELGKQLKQLNNSETANKYYIYSTLIDKYKLESITLQKRSTNTTK